MPPLQFQPISSQPTPAFWSALTLLKLDQLKLDDTAQPISGWLEEGRQVRDKEVKLGESSGSTGAGNMGMVGMDGVLGVSSGSFGGEGERPPAGSINLSGTFKNFNTIEDFRSTEKKKEIFDHVVDSILKSFETDKPNLNPFLLVTFADLKKYVYHYWFAFPALVSKPAWEVEGRWEEVDEEIEQAVRDAELRLEGGSSSNGFLLRRDVGASISSYEAAPISEAGTFFRPDTNTEIEQFIVFHDPSSSADHPGWPLRNILHYLSVHHQIRRVKVIRLRSGLSLQGVVSQPEGGQEGPPQAVGWERNKAGKLASKVVDLGPMLDPARLADQAVDLNLKLMRWRIMPDLDLDKVSSTKCLLLGAGTLGCYVARCLMGWGIRNITFVDSARVSFSNPVRQPLFDFEDCLDGGKPKAQCAADRLKRIFPGVNAQAHSFLIPMPGHPVSPPSEALTSKDIRKLEELIRSHDAVFLLMDSRESRWLPTVIAASEGKIVLNAALGFDTYLVMRHGGSPDVQAGDEKGKRLGCYYCNDVVAPTDSLTDRTLDQMCTVTRPGIAPIAAASAVELLVSLVQHPLRIDAPAESASSSSSSSASSSSTSPLGLVPHQIRGQLASWKNVLVDCPAFEQCTGCSPKVINEYRSKGFGMLLKVFNEVDYLEKLTGLDKLQEESEAMMQAVEWEGSESGDDF